MTKLKSDDLAKVEAVLRAMEQMFSIDPSTAEEMPPEVQQERENVVALSEMLSKSDLFQKTLALTELKVLRNPNTFMPMILLSILTGIEIGHSLATGEIPALLTLNKSNNAIN